jgi:hypothetical protein
MNISRYLRCHTLSLKHLIVIFLFTCPLVAPGAEPAAEISRNGSQECNEIISSFAVIQDTNGGSNNSIVVDLKEERTSFIISLVGPKRLFLQDVNDNEIKNLGKGNYSLVIVGRDESSGYCPKHFQIIIK